MTVREIESSAKYDVDVKLVPRAVECYGFGENSNFKIVQLSKIYRECFSSKTKVRYSVTLADRKSNTCYTVDPADIMYVNESALNFIKMQIENNKVEKEL